ncbi:hypothetical protein [Streptomyces exfoliatus]|uniref:hypothetical protein n=1 Tax=Streptomyces exfoliatus TaxID=1905 RepID=UPI003C2F2EB5
MPAALPARPAERAQLPAEFDADLRARLAALDAASDGHAAEQRPENTVLAYRSDWKARTKFCDQLQVPVTAATRGTLRAFVDYLWNREKRAYNTIDRKLAGVTVTLRQEYGVVIDPEDTKAARELLKDYRRRTRSPPRGRGKAPAMRVDALRQIVEKCSDDIFGVRDRAMLLLGARGPAAAEHRRRPGRQRAPGALRLPCRRTGPLKVLTPNRWPHGRLFR